MAVSTQKSQSLLKWSVTQYLHITIFLAFINHCTSENYSALRVCSRQMQLSLARSWIQGGTQELCLGTALILRQAAEHWQPSRSVHIYKILKCMHGRCPDKIVFKATEQAHMELQINGLISPVVKISIQSIWLFLQSSYYLKTLEYFGELAGPLKHLCRVVGKLLIPIHPSPIQTEKQGPEKPGILPGSHSPLAAEPRREPKPSASSISALTSTPWCQETPAHHSKGSSRHQQAAKHKILSHIGDRSQSDWRPLWLSLCSGAWRSNGFCCLFFSLVWERQKPRYITPRGAEAGSALGKHLSKGGEGKGRCPMDRVGGGVLGARFASGPRAEGRAQEACGHNLPICQMVATAILSTDWPRASFHWFQQ